jgi:AcrR family transcriptional regulator
VTGTTEERILRTFLRLVAERGIDATTTRLLAEEAGVNEVTLFRLFGDKSNLAAQAFRRFAPVDAVANYTLAIDASTPERALEGIREVLDFLRKGMLEHPEFVQFGMGEYWRLPELKDQIAASPRAARDLVERALDAAEPALRPGLDRRAASLSLVGLLLISVIWPARGWIDLSEPKWQAALTQAVQLLLRAD